MRLLHLTAVGQDKPPASIVFGPRLTVVYGASESGKSYMIDALNFMLGAKALRELPEAAGYQTMLLGIELADGRAITLARELRGGRVSVYDEDLRSLPQRVPDESLSAQHVTGRTNTISHYLLQDLGLAGAQVRRNERNNTQALGIRNLMHLCIVDEERILAKRSPVESGIPTARTADGSVFRLLIEGRDDSDLTGGEDPTQFRKTNRAQVEVLDRALSRIYESLGDSPERPALLSQLARLNASVNDIAGSIVQVLSRRDSLAEKREVAEARVRRNSRIIIDASAVVSRFGLLSQKYESDLERLDMVREVGTLLSYFQAGPCVLCGAAAEHQRLEHALYETAELAESIDSEIVKTRSLQSDLQLTIERVLAEERRASLARSEAREEITSLSAEIARLESDARPQNDLIAELLAAKSDVERTIGLWDRVAELLDLQASVAGEEPEVTDSVASGISIGAQRGFSTEIAGVLQAWRVPGSGDSYVSFDGAPDIVLEQRWRIDRGKGIRSILHAGFVTGLVQYCLERDLPHPGFVALDTPVLTYRDAEQGGTGRGDAEQRDVDDELVSQSVSEAFYEYLEKSFIGQAIVLENQTPPEINGDGCVVYFFTGTAGVGRSGFYPL